MALPGPPTIGERGESETAPDSWPNLLPTFKMKWQERTPPEAPAGGAVAKGRSRSALGLQALPTRQRTRSTAPAPSPAPAAYLGRPRCVPGRTGQGAASGIWSSRPAAHSEVAPRIKILHTGSRSPSPGREPEEIPLPALRGPGPGHQLSNLSPGLALDE